MQLLNKPTCLRKVRCKNCEYKLVNLVLRTTLGTLLSAVWIVQLLQVHATCQKRMQPCRKGKPQL